MAATKNVFISFDYDHDNDLRGQPGRSIQKSRIALQHHGLVGEASDRRELAKGST